MFKDQLLLMHLSLPFSLLLLCFSFILSSPRPFLLHTCTCLFFPPYLSHASAPPLISLHPPVAMQSSLNLHQPPHQHQSQQIKVSSCPFSDWYSLPPDRSTDVCFYPQCLGNKMWHISPHTPSVTPFVTPCIFLYEITLLIGELSFMVELLSFRR